MHASVVKAALIYQGNHWCLETILASFFPMASEQEEFQPAPEGFVSERERTLIEVLVSIDNKRLCIEAIQLLEAPPISRLNWLEQHGENKLIELALKHKNNTFIQYLFKENKLNQAAVNYLLKMAIVLKQWNLIKHSIYLTGDNRPDLELISDALVAAAEAGQLDDMLEITPSPGFFQVKRRKTEFPINSAQLLSLLTAHGCEATIEQLLYLQPHTFFHLLTVRCDVTDYSGRTFRNISAFQYALWAMDSQMWDMMLLSLQEAFNADYREADWIRQELERQYDEVLELGVNYTLNGQITQGERHFDFEPLIDALNTYIREYNRWSIAERQTYWCSVVGAAQRLVPVHVAQHYCDQENNFNEKKPFHHTRLSRTFLLYLWEFRGRNHLKQFKPWFPLTQNSGLGFDFAIGHSLNENRLTHFSATTMPVAELQDVRRCSPALYTLREARLQDIIALRAQLATPLQQSLGTCTFPGKSIA